MFDVQNHTIHTKTVIWLDTKLAGGTCRIRHQVLTTNPIKALTFVNFIVECTTY